MQIVDVPCPACESRFIVDRNLWSIGTVELRCPDCGHYFLPEGSPGTGTMEVAARASVPLRIFRPGPDTGT